MVDWFGGRHLNGRGNANFQVGGRVSDNRSKLSKGWSGTSIGQCAIGVE